MSDPRHDSLEGVHEPITDLFPRAGDRGSFLLSEEQVAFFHKNGYVKGGLVLDARQIGALREALERIRTEQNPRLDRLHEIDAAYREAPDRNVFHFLGAWLVEEAFHDILWHPAITTKASQLLATPKVRFWHDQVFYKPARHPGVVAWHQDYSYWTRATPARHVTGWVGLDDSTKENGCVHFVPGSHRWGLLPKLDLLQDMDGIREHLTTQQATEDQRPH